MKRKPQGNCQTDFIKLMLEDKGDSPEKNKILGCAQHLEGGEAFIGGEGEGSHKLRAENGIFHMGVGEANGEKENKILQVFEQGMEE